MWQFLNKESTSLAIYASFLTVVSILIFFLDIVYNALITSWQFFVRYQDKVICKWVRYQKLLHFIEPYHAPYTTEYHYWTGLLLHIRVIISLISALKFSFNPHMPVELLSTIVVVTGLLFVKGVTVTRIGHLMSLKQ